MPAAEQRSRSPTMASSVMAMIGMCSPLAFLFIANSRGRFKAVYLRHLDIHQHNVKVISAQGVVTG